MIQLNISKVSPELNLKKHKHQNQHQIEKAQNKDETKTKTKTAHEIISTKSTKSLRSKNYNLLLENKQIVKPVSDSLLLKLKEKKIKSLEEKMNELYLYRALTVMYNDYKQIELNNLLNGFGIIVLKHARFYEILYSQTDNNLVNKKFHSFILSSNKSLLLGFKKDILNSIDSDEFINTNITLKYDEKSLIDFSKDKYQLQKFEKKMKIVSIIKSLNSQLRKKILQHQKTSVLYKCYHWILIMLNLFFLFSIIIISISSIILENTYFNMFFSMTIIILAFILMMTSFMSFMLKFNFKSNNHKLISKKLLSILNKNIFELDNPIDSIHNTRSYFRNIIEQIINTQELFNHSIPNLIENNYHNFILKKSMKQKKYSILESAIEKKTNEIVNVLNKTKNPNVININKLNKSFSSMII